MGNGPSPIIPYTRCTWSFASIEVHNQVFLVDIPAATLSMNVRPNVNSFHLVLVLRYFSLCGPSVRPHLLLHELRRVAFVIAAKKHLLRPTLGPKKRGRRRRRTEKRKKLRRPSFLSSSFLVRSHSNVPIGQTQEHLR